jgi:hypothetical protein
MPPRARQAFYTRADRKSEETGRPGNVAKELAGSKRGYRRDMGILRLAQLITVYSMMALMFFLMPEFSTR